ncbi:hypothetical protein V501_01572 [Pseudogymnoascus sp. VKM F-4519 (FW-2642)]|nr:hypothetical protein V501_01572 [Pseudogymnoascus sp. VKM F-4519 (FW-2642)]
MLSSAKSVNSVNVPQVDGTSSLLQSARVTDTPPTPVSTTTPSREEGHSTYRGSYGAETTKNKYPIPPLLLTSPSQDYYLGIPESLVSSLIEVYYSDVYNASLLLHKRMFLEAVAAGTARPQVVLSVCAIASIFHLDAKNQTSLKEHGFSTQWAERAGKLAFQEVESPNEDNIVAFINLALFWYSQGSWRRSYIHKGNALQLAHLLGFGTERPDKEGSLESEIQRRRFWACYLMNCHAPESMSVPEISKTAQKLRLPWRDEDFEAGFCAEPGVSLDSGQSNGGIFSELVKAMTYWRAVFNLIKSPESSISARVSDIHALDAQIAEWWSKLPTSLHLTLSSISGTPHSVLPKLLLIHTVHHQCLCALHSSIVPLFSWGASDNTWLTARNLSAQIAFEHACKASTLFEAILTNSNESSAIPSFIAYAAYCGCAIQIPFMWCSEPSVREKAHANVRTNIRMIHLSAKYWKFSALLEIHFQYLYKMHAKDPVPLENEPKYLAEGKLKGFRISASHARDSILGHNSILWSRGDGYAESGEEVTDLGIQDENSLQPSGLTGQDFARTITPQGQCRPPSRAPIAEEDQLLTSADPNPTTIVQEDLYAQPSPTLDFFHPFLDPEILDNFPDGEVLDFSQYGTIPSSFDFFDGWALGAGEVP